MQALNPNPAAHPPMSWAVDRATRGGMVMTIAKARQASPEDFLKAIKSDFTCAAGTLRLELAKMAAERETAILALRIWALDGFPDWPAVQAAYKAAYPGRPAPTPSSWWFDTRSYTQRLRRARGAITVPVRLLRAASSSARPGSPAQAALTELLWSRAPRPGR